MTDQTTKVEDQKLAEVKKPTAQDFADRYQKLCEELGYRIVVSPNFVSRDDGTFSIVLNYAIGELPRK
jgi:hypothetical protein